MWHDVLPQGMWDWIQKRRLNKMRWDWIYIYIYIYIYIRYWICIYKMWLNTNKMRLHICKIWLNINKIILNIYKIWLNTNKMKLNIRKIWLNTNKMRLNMNNLRLNTYSKSNWILHHLSNRKNQSRNFRLEKFVWSKVLAEW